MAQNAITEKLLMGQVVLDGEDILSNLHESILGYILSFVPTLDAVRTSILSKSWICAWTSTTSLQFDDSLFCSGKSKEKERFVNFVNKVLLHQANSSIQSFFLSLLRYQYDPSQVSEWISCILGKGVKKLHIQYVDKVNLSSHALFNCTSLVELVLQMRCSLSVPISACLPNLQHLSISGITLVSNSSTHTEDLILSFPLLKVFEARGCEWSTTQNVSIVAPMLESFSISFWNSLSSESCKSAIKIYAPLLTKFSYEGDLEQDIILLNPSSIRDASVVVVVDEDKADRVQEMVLRAHTLLRQIHEVEHLKLCFYKVLLHAKDIFSNLPVFGRLTFLQLNEVAGEVLLDFLHKSPILETLVLLHGVSKFDNDLFSSALVPSCFLSSLKVFQFGGFNVYDHELSLARFVMANAAVLERMSISAAFWLRYSDTNIEKVKEQLLTFPNCSKFAMIELSDANCQ
ncbi:hypothetical protein L6164_018259 [Bauhinia variegata]|uniref:Uncharacterized protein n=1 Tax=Bauhinia variegata TaxID=167791 RepID=A0ACB9NBU8_BAUVA|nr:hypothetical protein L6164_018259 [Bauhinia variegata]